MLRWRRLAEQAGRDENATKHMNHLRGDRFMFWLRSHHARIARHRRLLHVPKSSSSPHLLLKPDLLHSPHRRSKLNCAPIRATRGARMSVILPNVPLK